MLGRKFKIVFSIGIELWNVSDLGVGARSHHVVFKIGIIELGNIIEQDRIAINVDTFVVMEKETGDKKAVIINRGGEKTTIPALGRAIANDHA